MLWGNKESQERCCCYSSWQKKKPFFTSHCCCCSSCLGGWKLLHSTVDATAADIDSGELRNQPALTCVWWRFDLILMPSLIQPCPGGLIDVIAGDDDLKSHQNHFHSKLSDHQKRKKKRFYICVRPQELSAAISPRRIYTVNPPWAKPRSLQFSCAKSDHSWVDFEGAKKLFRNFQSSPSSRTIT